MPSEIATRMICLDKSQFQDDFEEAKIGIYGMNELNLISILGEENVISRDEELGIVLKISFILIKRGEYNRSNPMS